MRATNSILASIALVLFAGCGEKKVETPEQLKEVFEKKTSESPQGQPPEIQAMVNQAAESLKKKDEAAAVATLQAVRSAPNLSVDQALAVQDMMVQAQKRLAERAAAGDPQAQAAMEMLKYKHR
jgi:hypothetical protein